MITALMCLLPPMFFAVVLGFVVLSLRYGKHPASFMVVLALICGIIVAIVVRVNFRDDYKYDEDEAYPAQEWHRITFLSDAPTELMYRPGEGLFAATNLAEVKIADVLPACIAGSRISQYDRNSSPPIELTSNPRVQLPPPPGQPLYQVTFDIPIQFNPEVDTDILGASSYAAYENGEVWCTERVVQRGQAIALGAAVSSGFRVLYNMTVGFLCTFVVVIALAVAHMELRRRTQKELT